MKRLPGIVIAGLASIAAGAIHGGAIGLHVSRTDGSPLIYNEESLWLPDFLVCRPEFAEAALRALSD